MIIMSSTETVTDVSSFETEETYSGFTKPVIKGESPFPQALSRRKLVSLWANQRASKYRASEDFDKSKFESAENYVQEFMDIYSQQFLPFPSITVCEDGEIVLEWINNSQKVAVASFEETGLMGYCIRDGAYFRPGANEVDLSSSSVQLPADLLEKVRAAFLSYVQL